MAATTSNSSSEELSESVDSASKIVNEVIQEYDVIETADTTSAYPEETKKGQTLPQASDEMDQKSQISEPKSAGVGMNINRNRLSSSDKGGTVIEEPIVPLPRVNCKEKIIICLDVSSDMEKMTFRSRAGDKYSPQMLAKRALSFFLQSKERLDKKHEYAIILLQETAIWARDFTSNCKEILNVFNDIQESDTYKPCETFDVSSLYDKIYEKVPLPKVEGDQTKIPPSYIVRTLFVYGRPNCPVQISTTESMKVLNSSPYFFFDALYIYEPLSEENACQEVFDSICDLDRKGLSYMLGASRNLTKLYDHMAQLLAHPLQRPVQGDTAYRIGSILTDEG